MPKNSYSMWVVQNCINKMPKTRLYFLNPEHSAATEQDRDDMMQSGLCKIALTKSQKYGCISEILNILHIQDIKD